MAKMVDMVDCFGFTFDLLIMFLLVNITKTIDLFGFQLIERDSHSLCQI